MIHLRLPRGLHPDTHKNYKAGVSATVGITAQIDVSVLAELMDQSSLG